MTTQNSRTIKLSSFSAKLLSSTALTAASLAALAIPANAQSIPDNALPQGEVVTHGSASYDRSTNNVLKITQNSGVVSADYLGGFNIGKDAAVLMVQKSSDKFVHIDKSAHVSIINGLFSGNGTNFILNRDGVLIGENATIDMGGFVAATGELGAGTDLDAGKIEINNFGAGAIDIKGGANISVADAGIAAFVSPTIRNAGVINARLGKVAFAAGDKVTLDLYGDKLVEIAVNDKLADAIIEHTGAINAEGGVVQMTAQAAKEAVDNIINVKGVVTVASATQQGGKIILSGGEQGKVNVEGTLDASGATGGGEIAVKGEGVVLSETSELKADGTDNGDGGKIVTYGDRYAIMTGRASARGGANSGNGGFVELSAKDAVGFNGEVDTSAENGDTGRFLIDPKNINLGDFSSVTMNLDLLADIIVNGNLDTLRIDDDALANTLRTTDVALWATDKIFTSSDFDISTWNTGIGKFSKSGITTNDLSLSADTINIDHNITLGSGGLTIKDTKAGDSFQGFGLIDAPHEITVKTVNLNAQILARSKVDGSASQARAAKIEGVADTVNVVSNKASINQAIQFAQAGKTVNVAAGTYSESVNVDRGLVIKGANAGTDANGVRLEETTVAGGSPAFVVNANGVTIDGFSMTGKTLTYGVQNNGGNNLVIKNNLISGASQSGIWANGGKNLDINHNKITSSGNDGIDIDNTTGTVSIAYNTIDGTSAGSEHNGIEILGTKNAVIDNNTIKNTGWNNINVAGAEGLNITNNTLSNSAAASGIGIWSGSNNTKIDANTITGSQYGIWNQGGALEISRNTIDGAAVDGVYLSNTISANIHNNFVKNTGTAGLYTDGSTSGVTVLDNSFSGNVKNIINATANIVNASFNWWGSVDEATVAGAITGSVDFSPYQGAGTDTDLVQVGYQGNNKTDLYVTDAGAQTTGIIQEAIDAATAASTVTVNAGTYTENININKALKLKGLTGAKLQAATAGNLVTVSANDVNIDPITFDGLGLADYGINANGVSGLIVDGNTFQNFLEAGVSATNTIDTLITGNTFDNTGRYGVLVNGGTGATIEGGSIANTFWDSIRVLNAANTTIQNISLSNAGTVDGVNGVGSGIVFVGATGAKVDNAKISNIARLGIYAGASSDITLVNNTITNVGSGTNTSAGDSVGKFSGIHIEGTNNLEVSGNTISGATKDGINLGGLVNVPFGGAVTGTVKIDGNVVNTTGEDGIDVSGGTGVVISGNFVGFADAKTAGADDNINGDGIRVSNSDSAVIKSNKVTQTNSTAFDVGSGIHVLGGTGVTVGGIDLADGNTLTEIEWDGVKLTGGSTITVQNNSLTNVERVGIYAGNVNGAVITQNTLVNGNTALADYGVISSDGGSNLTVTKNDIDGSAGHGIRLSGATGTNLISDNDIDGVAFDGIQSLGLSDVTISKNRVGVVDSANRDGIYATGGSGTLLIGGASLADGNTVTGSGDDGIDVENTGTVDVDITFNTVDNNNVASVVDANGIELSGVTNGYVYKNDVKDAGWDGINVQSSKGTIIEANTIADTKGASGIGLFNGVSDTTILNNTITNSQRYGMWIGGHAGTLSVSGNTVKGVTTEDGIYLNNSNGTMSISGNFVDGIGRDAISVLNSDGTVGNPLVITRNLIGYGDDGLLGTADDTVIGRDGIHVEGSDRTRINRNKIVNAADDGIEIIDSSNVTVGGASLAAGNLVNKSGHDGITTEGGNAVTIRYNTVTDTLGASAVAVHTTSNADVKNNIITNAALLGIYGQSSNRIEILDNTITNVGYNAPFVGHAYGNGIGVESANKVTITGNTVDTANSNGISVGLPINNVSGASTKVTIDNNKVKNTGVDGIVVDGGALSVSNNTINTTGNDGIDVRNSANADVNGNKVGYEFDGVTVAAANNIGADGIRVAGSKGVEVDDNTVINTAANGVNVSGSKNAVISDNTIMTTGQNGIVLTGGTNANITRNTIDDASADGIHAEDFGSAWISWNEVSSTGDDGIEAVDADFVAIYNNWVFGAGLLDNADSYGADGIHVRNVGGIEVLPPAPPSEEAEGFGYSIADADSQVYGNVVAFTDDDGIEVIDANRTYVYDNDVGHIGYSSDNADGIRVVDTDHSVIKHNRVSEVLDDGIRVKNGAYAGVFDNRVLLAGDDGIEVSGINWGRISDAGDVDYPSYGWAANLEDNQVVMVGDNGIYVRDGGVTRIVNNDVMGAGMGDAIESEVQSVADQIFDGEEDPIEMIVSLETWEWSDEPIVPSFGQYWGNGDGIKVSNVTSGDSLEISLSGLSFDGDSFEGDTYAGEWDVLIQGNDVSFTGGDGIDVSESGRTLIGGTGEDQANSVYQAGINWSEFTGYESFADLVSSGPFDSEDRRSLWEHADLIEVLGGFFGGDTLSSMTHGAHDGIRVSGVYNSNPYSFPAGFDGGDSGYYGYAVNIIGNDVNTTGDDGIEVAYSGSTLIMGNNVSGSGVGLYNGTGLVVESMDKVNYQSGDYSGADGINVHGVYGEYGLPVGKIIPEDGFRDYAVVIDGNTVDSTADDGIEVSDAGRTRIAGNTITNAGVFGVSGSYYMDEETETPVFEPYADGYGADGIHVRNVFGNDGFILRPLIIDSPEFVEEPYTQDWSVEIVDNSVGFYGTEEKPFVSGAADDGIQVLGSGNTLIEDNTVAHIGIGGREQVISYDGEVDQWGSDGIHVDGTYRYRERKKVFFDGFDGPVLDEELFAPDVTVNIIGNTVDITNDDGIQADHISDLLIESNDVSQAGDNGIEVSYSDTAQIITNVVDWSGSNGIYVDASDLFTIGGNTSNRNGADGILVNGSNDGFVNGNTVLNNQVGLRLVDVDNVGVIGNGFGFNSQYGVFAQGADNGPITLMSNIINASPVGARFESGAIDIASLGAPNIILGSGATIGLQFDEVGVPGSLTLVNKTIGATTFSGFLPVGSFYVRFEDGTLLDTVTGAPIVIDGLNANFDGLVPASQGGFLTPAQLAFLEARIFDADDVFLNGRGQLFVGAIPTAGSGLEDLEDFFNRYGTPGDGASGFSVTVRGLPNVTAAGLNALTPAAGNPGPAGLNSITPAAGGEETGTTAPQDIEPAAGNGEDVSCWSDAVSSSGATTFNFGGTFEESLSGAGKCKGGSI